MGDCTLYSDVGQASKPQSSPQAKSQHLTSSLKNKLNKKEKKNPQKIITVLFNCSKYIQKSFVPPFVSFPSHIPIAQRCKRASSEKFLQNLRILELNLRLSRYNKTKQTSKIKLNTHPHENLPFQKLSCNHNSKPTEKRRIIVQKVFWTLNKTKGKIQQFHNHIKHGRKS